MPKQGRAHHSHDVDVNVVQKRAPEPSGNPAHEMIAHLQRTAGNAAVASKLENGMDGSSVHAVLSQGGQPLDAGVRGVMESHLGADFSDVRVHADDQADASARAIDAVAYTSGNHIVFQRGQYQPNTGAGRQMLAHELTHVVQQREGPVDGTPIGGGVSVSDPSDRFEQQAEETARKMMG